MMIINGGSRSNGAYFAKHLKREDINERVEVCEMRGFCADTVRDAFEEMEAVAWGSRIKNYFYHANINPDTRERNLTPEEWLKAVDTLEKNLGLEGQPRIVVEHEKQGRTHRHVIWSRVDLETMRARSDSLNYQTHEQTSRALEIEFGLQRGESVLVPKAERNGPRPERTPEFWAMQKGKETGIDPRDVRREVTELWRTTDSGAALVAALQDAGYVVAQGDSRDFVIFDSAANHHSLARRISGVKVAQLDERMADVDRASLPSFEEGKAIALAMMAERQAERETGRAGGDRQAEKQPEAAAAPAPKTERGLNRTQGDIRLAFSLTDSGEGFANALEDRGLILSQVTAADIARRQRDELAALMEGRRNGVWMAAEGGASGLNSAQLESAKASFAAWDEELQQKYGFESYVSYTQEKHAERLQELTRAADANPQLFSAIENAGPAIPAYAKEGDLVAVNGRGQVYALNKRTLGIEPEEITAYLRPIDRAALLSVADAQAVMAEVKGMRAGELLHKQEAEREALAERQAAQRAAIENRPNWHESTKGQWLAHQELSHEIQCDRLTVRQYYERQRARVVDPERDKAAAALIMPQKFADAAADLTRTGPQKDRAEEALREQRPPPVELDDSVADFLDRQEIDREERQAARRERQAEAGVPSSAQRAESAVHGMANSATKSFATVLKTGEKLMDLVDGALDFFFATPRTVTPREAAVSKAAMIEYAQAAKFEQQREAAYERMFEDIAAGRHLSRADVRYLSESDRKNYRMTGDAHLEQMLRAHEIEEERKRQRSREL